MGSDAGTDAGGAGSGTGARTGSAGPIGGDRPGRRVASWDGSDGTAKDASGKAGRMVKAAERKTRAATITSTISDSLRMFALRTVGTWNGHARR